MKHKFREKFTFYVSKVWDNERLLLFLIFIVSFVIRLIAVFYLKNYVSPVDWEDGAVARNLIAGKGFSAGWHGPLGPTSTRTPFYPFFLAFFYHFWGINNFTFLLIEIVQAAVSAFISVTVYLIAKKVFSSNVGKLSSLIAMCYPLFIWYSSRISQTIFTMLFICLIIFAFLKIREVPSYRNLIEIYTKL